MSVKKRWYVVQTYSGSEDSVKQDIERRIESMGMQNFIFNVIIPEETLVEKKLNAKGEEETITKVKKIFPGYVFVEMIITDESWHVIRNTPQVTGFLGSSGGRTKPVPVEPEEMNQILLNIGAIEKPKFKHEIGEVVTIARGPFEGFMGEVLTFDNQKQTVLVNIEVFGRGTPTEFSFTDIKEE
ncbi:MAG: transcription termination/antitermination factor NusG [Acholeplasmataceae bacterium]|jgi:transcriptional antiterminator NusG|nr:transcription termination/antitermination factor NusG [Acholeplasmataceae bacterium]